MEPILQWVTEYGYAALFSLLVLGIVGLPVPDEALLVFSGYLVYKGRLLAIPTALAAFCGTACGISLSYLIGHAIGLPAIHRYGKYVHLTAERLEGVHRWFERVGDWLLAIGYFIPGVRHFTAIVAGASGLEFRKFAAFAYSGAAVWVTVFVGAGYLLGEKWHTVVEVSSRYSVVIVLLVFLLACISGLVAYLRRSRRQA